MTCFLLGPDPARTVAKIFKNSVSRVWSHSWFTKERQRKQSHRKGKRLAEEISRYIICFKIGIKETFFPVSPSLFLEDWAYPFPSLCAMLHIYVAFLSGVKKSTWSSALRNTKCCFSFYIYLPVAETVAGMPCPGTRLAQHPERIDRRTVRGGGKAMWWGRISGLHLRHFMPVMEETVLYPTAMFVKMDQISAWTVRGGKPHSILFLRLHQQLQFPK